VAANGIISRKVAKAVGGGGGGRGVAPGEEGWKPTGLALCKRDAGRFDKTKTVVNLGVAHVCL
jgi:hypothetical protein